MEMSTVVSVHMHHHSSGNYLELTKLRNKTKSSHSLSSTCMEQLAAVVHPTRIDGCAEKESVALAAAVYATRIHAKVAPPAATNMEEAEATIEKSKS